jgi:hypothetical protein
MFRVEGVLVKISITESTPAIEFGKPRVTEEGKEGQKKKEKNECMSNAIPAKGVGLPLGRSLAGFTLGPSHIIDSADFASARRRTSTSASIAAVASKAPARSLAGCLVVCVEWRCCSRSSGIKLGGYQY